MPLEDHYAGDAAFANLIAAIEPLIESAIRDWPDWPQLVDLCGGDNQLARGVFYVADRGALAWLQERPPILEGLTPAECLATEAGQQRLKETILRYGGPS